MLPVLFLRKNLSLKDWDSFLAVYGIPSVFLIGPPNTLEGAELRETLEQASVAVSGDCLIQPIDSRFDPDSDRHA
jgi:phage gp29-like protein